MLLTDDSMASSSCHVDDSFASVAYVKMSRYGGRTNGPGSTVTIRLLSSSEQVIVVHDDKIRVGDQECSFSSSSRVDEPFWLRLRVHPVAELDKTFFSLAVAAYQDTDFVKCVQFEMDSSPSEFGLQFEAETATQMRQTVDRVQTRRPDFGRGQSDEVLKRRVERLEERVRRMQKTLTDYIHSHDSLASTSFERHASLQSSLNAAHNRIVHRTNIHGMMYLFCFCLVIMMGCAYAGWHNLREKRLHLF